MKTCSSCKEAKALTDFNRNKRKADGLQAVCRPCSAASSKRYYSNRTEHHKRYVIAQRGAYRERNREYVINYLLNHPCTDCDESDIVVLEFDHVRGTKVKNVSELMSNASLEKLQDEIAKCEVVCANCHRRRTSSRASWYRSLVVIDGA